MSPSPRQQRTIAAPVSIQGTGYWTGQAVTVEFRPASPDIGIVFIRRDLTPVRRISAVALNCVETPRRTTITSNGGTVEMIEHLMAALHGLQIDNCEVWVDAREMPACDGSSLEVTEALATAGTVSQEALRPHLVVDENVRVGDDSAWIEALPCAEPGLTISYHLDYGKDHVIGRQDIETLITPTIFRQELAGARTFVTEVEARRMQLSGLGKNVTYDDILVFGEDGPLENSLRFHDECVRHKVLDIVGDIALAGVDIHGHIRAFRSGHRLNGELVRALTNQGRSALRHTA